MIDTTGKDFILGKLTPPPSTRDLQLSSGDSGAILSQGRTQSEAVGDSAPSAKFGLALMDLLKRYQTLGTGQFAQQGFNAQDEQNRRVLGQTSPDLIGASPALQNSVRGNSAQALNPTIQGAQQGAQTFSEQIRGLGNTIDTARNFMKDYESQQNSARDDARSVLHDIITTYGGDELMHYAATNPDEVKKLEKLAGYPTGYLASSGKTLKEKEVAAKLLKLSSSSTGGTVGADGQIHYSPLEISRYSLGANRIVNNFIDLPQYKLTANALPYLQRIQAADSLPGSVSDAELLDSIVKVNTGGNAVTEAQVKLITGGRSFSDAINVWKNKLNNGGVLSDSQRKQLTDLATKVYARYESDYQPIYDQVTKQLSGAGIPKAFWTIPDLNTLSSNQGLVGQVQSPQPASFRLKDGTVVKLQADGTYR